jgi:uncharacterized protein YoxC
MEITSFVLGMLSIVAVAIVAVIVVGMLKINKLEKSNENLQQLCVAIESDLRRLITDTNRELTMVERTIMQRIDKEVEETHRHINNEVEGKFNDTNMNLKQFFTMISMKHVDTLIPELTKS